MNLHLSYSSKWNPLFIFSIPLFSFSTHCLFYFNNRGNNKEIAVQRRNITDQLKMGVRHSISMYKAIGQTILLLLVDLLTILQLIIIFIGVIEIPMFCYESFKMTVAYFKAPNFENISAPLWPKRARWQINSFKDDVSSGIDLQISETGKRAPLSLSFYRHLIIRHFYLSIALFPHFFFIPLKFLGVLLVPLILYLRMRFSRAAASVRPKSEGEELPEILTEEEKELQGKIRAHNQNLNNLKNKKNIKTKGPTALTNVPIEKRGKDLGFGKYSGWEKSKLFSFLAQPMFWIFVVSETRLNFWGLDQMLILNSVCFVFTLSHELGWFFFAVNYVLIAILTLGSPFWQGKVKKLLGWETLGGGPDGLVFRIFEGTLLIIQVQTKQNKNKPPF